MGECMHVMGACIYVCSGCMHTCSGSMHAMGACVHACFAAHAHRSEKRPYESIGWVHALIHSCMHACMHACIYVYLNTDEFKIIYNSSPIEYRVQGSGFRV